MKIKDALHKAKIYLIDTHSIFLLLISLTFYYIQILEGTSTKKLDVNTNELLFWAGHAAFAAFVASIILAKFKTSKTYKKIQKAYEVFRELTTGEMPLIINSYKDIQKHNERNRVVILLPLSFIDEHYNHEVTNAIMGLGHGLKNIKKIGNVNNYKMLDGIEIIFRSHENDIGVTKGIIISELALGTRHFICTMSNICEKLSDPNNEHCFKNILKQYSESKSIDAVHANLIMTIATSNQIKTDNDGLYRIFPVVEREAQMIVEELKKAHLLGEIAQNKNKFVLFTSHSEFNHKYLSSLHTSIKQCLKKNNVTDSQIQIINLDKKSNAIGEEVEGLINKYKNDLVDCKGIFVICKYSFNEIIIQKIIELKAYTEGTYLITPSALPGLNYRYKNREGNSTITTIKYSGLKWLYFEPRKIKRDIEGNIEQEKDDHFYGEFCEYFVNVTIRKVIATMKSNPEYTAEEFDSIWSDKESVVQQIPATVYFDYFNEENININKVPQYRDPIIGLVPNTHQVLI